MIQHGSTGTAPMITKIIDAPCGYGKSTLLLKELSTLTKSKPEMKFLIVLPELGEVQRFMNQLGSDWHTPGGVNGTTKTAAVLQLMAAGKNIITTHALYKHIRKFEHLLHKYDVVIDEVPTVAEEVRVQFGRGIFGNLIYKQMYIEIDPVTLLISATSNWAAVADQYDSGMDVHIKKFMEKVIWSNVYYVSGWFCVMPLPDAFFTKPKSLKIITFLFAGTQLEHYMKLRGFKYVVQLNPVLLKKFKAEMQSNLLFYQKSLKDRTGYTVMTGKNPRRRKQVGHFIKNALQELRKTGQPVDSNLVLVAASKDAWHGRELNPNSKVINSTRLKSLTKVGKANYTALVTRGTNKFRHCRFFFMLGKLNMNPKLAEFLNMRTKKAMSEFELSELIQVLYRTAIRDKKPIVFVSPDKANIKLLEGFLKS